MADNNIKKLIRALVAPMQDLEDALQQLLTERSVGTAIGAQLDILGKIVGEPRNGLDDDTYRRRIRARIFANRSDGLAEDMLTIAELVIFDEAATYLLDNEGTATFRLRVDGVVVDDDLAAVLFSFLRSAVSAGVRVLLEWSTELPEDTFTFDSGPGFDVGHLARAVG